MSTHVCVSVYPRTISRTTRLIVTKYFMRVTYDRGWVPLRLRCDRLCTSVFMDYVHFAHNGQ